MQIYHELETGVVCVFINNFTYNYGDDYRGYTSLYCVNTPKPIKVILTLILAIVAPPIILVLAIVFLPLVGVIASCFGCCEMRLGKCFWVLLLPILLVLWALEYAILAAVCAIVCPLIMVLFYIIFILLVFRIIYMNLCKSRKINKRNKILLEHKKDEEAAKNVEN